MRTLVLSIMILSAVNISAVSLPGIVSGSFPVDEDIKFSAFTAMNDTLFLNVTEGNRTYIYKSYNDGGTWMQVCNDAPRIMEIYGNNIFGMKILSSTDKIIYSYINGSDWSVYADGNSNTSAGLRFFRILRVPDERIFTCWYDSHYGTSIKIIETGMDLQNSKYSKESNKILPEVHMNGITNIGNRLFVHSFLKVFEIPPFQPNPFSGSLIPIGEDLFTDSIYSIYTIDTMLLVSTRTGLFCSVDEGATFSRVDNGTDPVVYGTLKRFGPSLLMVNAGGVHRSPDTGKTWKSSFVSDSVSLAVGATKLFIMTKDIRFLCSEDSGNTWNDAPVAAYTEKKAVTARVVSRHQDITIIKTAVIEIAPQMSGYVEILTLNGKCLHKQELYSMQKTQHIALAPYVSPGIFVVRYYLRGRYGSTITAICR